MNRADQVKAIGEALGWTDIHGGPEDGGAYWRGTPPGGKRVVACPDWLGILSAPAINATLIQAGDGEEGTTITFSVTPEDLIRWINQRGGLALYRSGNLTLQVP